MTLNEARIFAKRLYEWYKESQQQYALISEDDFIMKVIGLLIELEL